MLDCRVLSLDFIFANLSFVHTDQTPAILRAQCPILPSALYMRVPILHNLVSFEVPLHKLINIYILYIRLVLEQSATVWHSSLTCEETRALERVQKVCLKIILKDRYVDYENALAITGLSNLDQRRTELCRSFALNCAKNPKTENMFPRKMVFMI